MDWFQGPLDTFFGIPTFWVERFAKLIQLISASYVILELVGEDRVEQASTSAQKMLDKAVQLRFFSLPRLTVYNWFRGTTGIPHPNQGYFPSPGGRFGPLITVAIAAVFSWHVAVNMTTASSSSRPLLIQIYTFLLMFVLVGMPGVLVAFFSLSLIISSMLMQMDRFLIWFSRLLRQLLRRRSLANLLLIISIFLLAIGSILEIIAS